MDSLHIEILDDGTIKTTTSKVSAANHQNAEQFLQLVARLAGGTTTRERNAHAHAHAHGIAHHHDGDVQKA